MPKPRDLKSENIGSMPQRAEYSSVSRFFGHRDDPGLGVPRIMNDAAMGSRPPPGQLDVFQRVDPVLGAAPGRRPASAVDHHEIALQAQAIIPAALLAPADQVGGAIETVAQQPDPGRRGKPGDDRIK